MTLDQNIDQFSAYGANCALINTRISSFLNLLDTQVNAANHLIVRRSGAWSVEGITVYNGLYQDFGNISGSVVLEINNHSSLSGIMFTAVGETLIDGFGDNFVTGHVYTIFIKQNALGGNKVRWPVMASVLGSVNEDPNAITISMLAKLPDRKMFVKNNAYLPNTNVGYYEFRVVDDYMEISKSSVSVSGNVFDNDWGSGAVVVGINGDPLNVGVGVAGSEGGIFTVGSDGSWTFVLGSSFEHLTGSDSLTSEITYTATNSEETLTASLRILVRGRWLPDDDLDMLQWLDADDADTLNLNIDSNKVVTWSDKSGKGADITQATDSSRPVVEVVSGKNTIYFSGGKNLVAAAILTERAHCIFYVVEGVGNIPACGQTTSGTCLYNKNAGAITSASQGGVGEQIGANGIAAHQHRANIICNILYKTQALSGYNIIMYEWLTRQPKVYLNGVLFQTGLTANQTANFWMNMGAGAYGSFVGRVRERIYTNGIPSTDLIDKTVGYLAHKWSLTDKLEETHPYKYIIP